MGKKWQRDRKKDYYYKKAKTEDYRSRASYKLKELNKKFRLIRGGDFVLDLGAAPGGWMQVAGEIVGDKGVVVGVDLSPIEPFDKTNINALQGDITAPETLAEIKRICEHYNVVISDASPDISGAWDVDHFNSIELAHRSLKIAVQVLKEEGNLLVKVFQGNLINDFTKEVKREFEFVKITKPKASRKGSSEVYVVGKRLLRTPVRYGDLIEVVFEEERRGFGIAKVEGFKIEVEGCRKGERASVRIKKVFKNKARAVKVPSS